MDYVLYILFIVFYAMSILILVSLGLSIIFGLMGIVNFAHGEFLMVGAYTVLAGRRAGIDLWISILLAPIIVGLIGLAIERLIIRHLYGRITDTILATWGISLVLVQLAVIIFGPATQGIGTPLGSLHIGGYSISKYMIVIMSVTAFLVLLVYIVLSRTRYGIEAQAVTQLPQIASAMGINSQRTMMITFALGSALSGLAGALIAPTVGVIPTLGIAFIARAFMGVILGGQAVISGLAAAGGLLCTGQTIVATLTQPFLGQGALLFIALIVLRFMPRGLSGNWRRQL
jgi:branched-subunit amino acid ABC-type transport system permease component